MYSILLMNATVPLLNRWTRPLVFGEGLEEEVPENEKSDENDKKDDKDESGEGE